MVSALSYIKAHMQEEVQLLIQINCGVDVFQEDRKLAPPPCI
jgi:hypothetical protein